MLGPVAGRPDDDDEPVRTRVRPGWIGPLVTSLAEPPVVEGPAFVVAIGWVSRLPSDRLEWRDGAWWEMRLSAGHAAGAGLAELLVPLDRSARRLGRTPGPCDAARPIADGARYRPAGSGRGLAGLDPAGGRSRPVGCHRPLVRR